MNNHQLVLDPDDDSQGGQAGTNGAGAIRETSGVSFTFNTTGGTIEPASFATASNAAQNVT